MRHKDPRACRRISLEVVGVVKECLCLMLRLPPLQRGREVDS